MRRTLPRTLPVCVLLLVLHGMPASARVQAQTTIVLEGRVIDGSGAPIPNAQVSASVRTTGEQRQTLTRDDGEFRILALSPGTYTVTASAPGFQPHDQLTELVIGQRPRLTFELRATAFELAPVEVATAGASAAEIRRTSVSTPVLEQDIRDLPLSTRNVMDLAGLAPGIRSFRPLGGHFLPSAGALRGERFLNLYVDGLELKNVYDGNVVGFPHTGSPLPADALKELRVYLQPYDAAYARAAAYVISAVTHRGTNETHGSTFGFLQHRDLVADNRFLRSIPNFTGADFQRQQVGATLRGPLVRDRLFYAASYELSNGRSYIAVVPNRPAYEPDLWNDHAGVFAAPHRNQTGTARLTWVRGDRHTFDAIGTMRHLTNESRFGSQVSHESAVEDEHLVTSGNLRHRWIATERLANELSVQFVGWSNTGRALTPRSVFAYLRSLRIGAPTATFELDERHVRLIDRLTWAPDSRYGNHLVTAGIEVARVSTRNFFPIWSRGMFVFAADSSTLPIRALIGVGATSPDTERDALASWTGWVTGVYVQHEWRPVPNLSLSLGLRHDAEFNLLNNDHVSPWAADPELAASPTLQRYLNHGGRDADLDNISPRVSISWDVFDDRRTFLRGGFGIMYDRIPGFIAFQERRDAAWRTYAFDDPQTTDPAVLRQRVVAGGGIPSFALIANDMEAPENRQWSVGLGHEITPTLALNVDYVDQHVRNLFAEMNLNWTDASVTPSQRALSSRYGDIIVWDDFARARYRALLTRLTWQPRTALRLNLAHTLGYAEAQWDAANQSVPAAMADQFYVMQRTTGDERHRFVLSGLVPLPLAATLSVIGTAASPRPYAAVVGQDLNQNGVLYDDWIDGRRFLTPPATWRNWYRVVDVRLARSIALPRGVRGAVMLEAFNIFNTENFSSFNGDQRTQMGEDNPRFRQPDGVFGTRQLQVGTRIEF